MRNDVRRPNQRLRGECGHLMAVLALLCQITLGFAAAPDAAEAQSAAAVDALTSLCSPGALPPGHAPPHHHHTPDCVLCPLGAAVALQAVLPGPAPVLPAPSSQRMARIALPPPPRGPPAQPRPTPPPRGPPHLA